MSIEHREFRTQMPDEAEPSHPLPAPHRLPGHAAGAEGGRLKIFLGAAPGVGKTFALLESAHERRSAGADVVVGIVETHGRAETQALVDALEVLPRRRFEAGGRTFEELDLDAVLARRPGIVLVDDLAHTNPPGSRHLERWQDVDEILAAGIDVWATLNIQHLESLKDVVERIAGIEIRATVPDSVLHQADEIEVADLSPDDLLTRLAEGKVHLPEEAGAAVHALFSRGNLTALREIVLRQAAERVDAQVLEERRSGGEAGGWPARQRLAVCCGRGAAASRLVRAAKRTADRMGAPWTAVYVETHRHHRLPEEAKDHVAQALRLAEQLGGETRVLQGEDVAGEILAWARDNTITHLLIGRRRRRRPRWLPGASPSDRILDGASGLDVLVLGAIEGEGEPARWDRSPPSTSFLWWRTALALLGVGLVSGAGWLVQEWLPLPNIAVAYLVVVLVVAIELGLRPAIFASVLSFLAFNFLFTEPRLSLRVADARNVISLIFFLGAAFITSNLAGRVRRQMEATRVSARRTRTLYEFSRRVAGTSSLDDVLWAVAHHVAAAMHGQSLVLLPQGETLEIRAAYPPEDRLDEADREAAEWAWSHGVPTGQGTTTLPAASWSFLPMRMTGGPVGVLGVRLQSGTRTLTSEQSRLLEALAGQAALAIERTSLVADVENAKLAADTDALRAAVLSSLSKELKTPVVSILGAASRLVRADDQGLDAAARHELALLVEDDAERLDHSIQNLLDMTRLGSGMLKPRLETVDLRDVVDAALDRAARLLKQRRVCVDIEPELPRLWLDRVLIEQVLFNLIDNACRYSPEDGRIGIWTRRRGDRLLLEVSDDGPGIPTADRERVFDMFYRVEGAGGSDVSGLGLATSRGIVEAHGGRIRVESGLGGVGASICIQLPLAEAPPQDLPAPEERDAVDRTPSAGGRPAPADQGVGAEALR